MLTRTRLVATLVTASLAVSGCSTYQSFPRAEAASDQLRATLAEQSRLVEQRDYATDEEHDERVRYLARVLESVTEFEKERTELYAVRLSSAEARQLDLALANMIEMLETFAVFPGRIDKDGNPVDRDTAQILDRVDRTESPIG